MAKAHQNRMIGHGVNKIPNKKLSKLMQYNQMKMTQSWKNHQNHLIKTKKKNKELILNQINHLKFNRINNQKKRKNQMKMNKKKEIIGHGAFSKTKKARIKIKAMKMTDSMNLMMHQFLLKIHYSLSENQSHQMRKTKMMMVLKNLTKSKILSNPQVNLTMKEKKNKKRKDLMTLKMLNQLLKLIK